MKKFIRYFETKIGPMSAEVDDSGLLLSLGFEKKPVSMTADDVGDDHPALNRVVEQVQEYYEGKRQTFDLPVSLHGTPFQIQVWQELQRIPYGQTISYVELARRVGNPTASRAVGRANGSNPIAIVVPCHRVIGANGTLTGYAGGIENKHALLALEGVTLL